MIYLNFYYCFLLKINFPTNNFKFKNMKILLDYIIKFIFSYIVNKHKYQSLFEINRIV